MAWREDLYNPYRLGGNPLIDRSRPTPLNSYLNPLSGTFRDRIDPGYDTDPPIVPNPWTDPPNPAGPGAPYTPPGGGGGRYPPGDTTNPPPVPPPVAPPPPPAPNRNDPATSRNAPRLTEENGQWVLTEHGNRRVLQPGEVEGARAYVEDFWRQFPTGFQPGVGPQTNEGYNPPPGTNTTPGGRRVPITGREDQANLWGIHNPEIWTNADATELNRRAIRILMRYAATPQGIQQAMQDPDWLADLDLRNATYSGSGDRIHFHGALSDGDHGVPVNEVDVLAAYDAATGQSQGYRWGDVDAMGRATPTPTTTTTTPPGPTTTPTPTPTPTPPPPGTTIRPPGPNPPPDGTTFPGGWQPATDLSKMRDPANIFGPTSAGIASAPMSQEPYRQLVDPTAPLPLNEYARLGKWRPR